MSMKALLVPALIILAVLATFATAFGNSIQGWTDLQNALSTNPFESLPQLPNLGGPAGSAVLTLVPSAVSIRGDWWAIGFCNNASYYFCLKENDGDYMYMKFVVDATPSSTMNTDIEDLTTNYLTGKTVTKLEFSLTCKYTEPNPQPGDTPELHFTIAVVGTGSVNSATFLCSSRSAYEGQTVTYVVDPVTAGNPAWNTASINALRLGVALDSYGAIANEEKLRISSFEVRVYSDTVGCVDFFACSVGVLQGFINIVVFVFTGVYVVLAGIVLSIIWGTSIAITFFSAVIETAGFIITIGNTAPLLISLILGGVFVVLMAIVFFAGVEYLTELRGGGV